MDKILSARVDESIVRRIGSLAKHMRTTKKAVIEAAVRQYAEHVKSGEADVFDVTLGAWSRKETPGQTVAKVRKAFLRSVGRHHQ